MVEKGASKMIIAASKFQQTDIVITGIILIGVIGYAIEMLMRKAEVKLIPWKGSIDIVVRLWRGEFSSSFVILIIFEISWLSVFRLKASSFLFAKKRNAAKEKFAQRAPKTPPQSLKLTAVQMRHPWRN